jgi:hypothetical protein
VCEFAKDLPLRRLGETKIALLPKEVAAETAINLFGCEATLAVAYCALDARVDGSQKDYHFWLEVFKLLRRA